MAKATIKEVAIIGIIIKTKDKDFKKGSLFNSKRVGEKPIKIKPETKANNEIPNFNKGLKR